MLKLNSQEGIKFGDGKAVPSEKAAIYLGAEIRADNIIRTEIQRRMATCIVTWNKLHLFWRHSNTPIRTKLIVFDAVVRSKLVYGLETVRMTTAQLNRINAFQLKGLRQI